MTNDENCTKDIDGQAIMEFMKELEIKTKKEFAICVDLPETNVIQWIKGTKPLTTMHKKMWFYIMNYFRVKKEIERLKQQLQGKEQINNNQLKNEVDKLSKNLIEFKKEIDKRFENLL